MSSIETKGTPSKMTITAAGDLAAGDLYPIRSGNAGLCGVIFADAVSGDEVVLEYGHQAKLAKKSSDTFASGALVYWDNSAKELTTTTSGNTLAGFVTEAAGSSTTEAWIQLTV